MNGKTTGQMGFPAPDSVQGLIQQISYPLYNCKGWMKFVGVLSIISGALQAISIFGIIIAWLPIWIGVLLFQAASAAEEAHYTGSEHELIRSLTRLKTYFIIIGVMTLIMILFSLLVLVLVFTGAFFSMFHMRSIY